MSVRSCIGRVGIRSISVILVVLGAVSASHADEPPALPVVPAADTMAAVTHLENLAESGRFSEVLARLETDYAHFQNESLRLLILDLRRYDASQRDHATAKRNAHDEALAKVATERDKGRLESALVAAIEAHGLASNPGEVLLNQHVKDLVAEAQQQAQAAEAEHDWVRALSLYRALDLLYDDYATYRSDFKRVFKHVQVLQLYVPAKLQELYKAQQARRAAAEAEDKGATEDNPQKEEGTQRAERDREEALALDTESWETRLRGIDVSMLRQTLASAARQHVDRSTAEYLPLVRGALESLQIVLDTDDLAATFPTFADASKRQALRARVSHELKALPSGQNASLGYIDATDVIERVLKANRTTLALPESVVIYELAEGATATLDDFSAVIWPEETDQFKRSTQGTFSGVGVQISRRDGQLIVVTPLPGTPAQKSGIKAGDIIATVDGRDTSSWVLDKAVREITGPEGTPVTLGIRRGAEAEIFSVELRRAEIIIESIRGWEMAEGGWNYWIDPHERIGYIRLSGFLPQSAMDLDKAVAQMQADGPINGLILDLRFNPGGLLSAAVDVVDRFITEGPIVYTVDSKGKKQNPSRAKGQKTYPDFPLVVLINQGSASASEIVSGALQDYDRALIVGTRSFGKGSVQDVFPLASGEAALKLTTQYYMLPLGRIIHRKPDAREWGVVPDLVVEMTNQQVADSLEYRQAVDVLRDADDLLPDAAAEAPQELPTAQAILDKGMDPQLSAALLVLKTRLVAKDLAIAQARAQAAEPLATP